MKRYLYIYSFLLLSGFCFNPIFPQEANFFNKRDKEKQINEIQNIFNELESAITNGRVQAISKLLSQHTYFSLSNGKSGYFSSNQAYYVLEDFFQIYQVSSFKFQNIQAGENNPYATGVYNFKFKGKRNSAQVYISLKKFGSSWKITQITIN